MSQKKTKGSNKAKKNKQPQRQQANAHGKTRQKNGKKTSNTTCLENSRFKIIYRASLTKKTTLRDVLELLIADPSNMIFSKVSFSTPKANMTEESHHITVIPYNDFTRKKLLDAVYTPLKTLEECHAACYKFNLNVSLKIDSHITPEQLLNGEFSAVDFEAMCQHKSKISVSEIGLVTHQTDNKPAKTFQSITQDFGAHDKACDLKKCKSYYCTKRIHGISVEDMLESPHSLSDVFNILEPELSKTKVMIANAPAMENLIFNKMYSVCNDKSPNADGSLVEPPFTVIDIPVYIQLLTTMGLIRSNIDLIDIVDKRISTFPEAAVTDFYAKEKEAALQKSARIQTKYEKMKKDMETKIKNFENEVQKLVSSEIEKLKIAKTKNSASDIKQEEQIQISEPLAQPKKPISPNSPFYGLNAIDTLKLKISRAQNQLKKHEENYIKNCSKPGSPFHYYNRFVQGCRASISNEAYGFTCPHHSDRETKYHCALFDALVVYDYINMIRAKGIPARAAENIVLRSCPKV